MVWESKNGRARTVPMTTRAYEVIERRRKTEHAKNKGPFSFWHRKEVPLTQLKRVQKALGLEDIVIHTLRHTFASRLVQRGVHLKHVQELMVHNSINTTMIYAHLAPQDLEGAISVLNGD